LQSRDGVISEQEISDIDIQSLPKLLADSAKNEELNIVHRVASLRKLLEHMPGDDAAQGLAYNILSCLLHGKAKPTYVSDIELSVEEVKSGENFITQYIAYEC